MQGLEGHRDIALHTLPIQLVPGVVHPGLVGGLHRGRAEIKTLRLVCTTGRRAQSYCIQGLCCSLAGLSFRVEASCSVTWICRSTTFRHLSCLVSQVCRPFSFCYLVQRGTLLCLCNLLQFLAQHVTTSCCSSLCVFRSGCDCAYGVKNAACLTPPRVVCTDSLRCSPCVAHTCRGAGGLRCYLTLPAMHLF